jgi:hypothetical protein
MGSSTARRGSLTTRLGATRTASSLTGDLLYHEKMMTSTKNSLTEARIKK